MPPDSNLRALQQEWVLLQNQYDSYEKFSLLIKLISLVLSSYFLVQTSALIIAACFCLILWGLDGIWKTFQGRLEQRLLIVEQSLAADESVTAMQFNQQWQDTRPSTLNLILEYCKQASRPTVAFPHVVLLAIIVLSCAFAN